MICGRVGILREADAKLDSFFTASAAGVGPGAVRLSHEAGLEEPQSSSPQLAPFEASRTSIETEHGCSNDAEVEGESNTFVDSWTATLLEETYESFDPGGTPTLADNRWEPGRASCLLESRGKADFAQRCFFNGRQLEHCR